MIKANELRIGNLVYLELGLPGLSIHNVKAQDIADYENGRITIEAVKPIPLTPEWLERMGFEWKDGYLKLPLKHGRMELGFYAGVSDKMTLFQTGPPYEGSVTVEMPFGSNHPVYVHQLQNLYFALTGEEIVISTTPA